ncbi:hypothetical protein HK405_010234 [Cladochytrium tenue]|nr:hypothetical protein HK405_010234 [Cladochytrium tenue]
MDSTTITTAASTTAELTHKEEETLNTADPETFNAPTLPKDEKSASYPEVDPSTTPANLSIAIMTVMFGNDWYFPISLANKRAYADRHGYDLIILDDRARDSPPHLAPSGDPSPHPAWSKVSGLRRHIQDYDWIWLLDADAFITNPEIRIQDFVDDVRSLHLARSPDDYNADPAPARPAADVDHARWRAPGPPPTAVLPYPPVRTGLRTGPDIILAIDCFGVNAGSLLIRGARSDTAAVAAAAPASSAGVDSRPWAVQLVDFWLAMEPMPDFHANGLLEQRALGTIIDGNVLDTRRKVAAVPPRTLNSYAPAYTLECSTPEDPYTLNHQPGDWVVHFIHVSKPSLTNRTLRALGVLPLP